MFVAGARDRLLVGVVVEAVLDLGAVGLAPHDPRMSPLSAKVVKPPANAIASSTRTILRLMGDAAARG